MKKYVLSATYKGMTTTRPIFARNTFNAKVMASSMITTNHVSDRRFAKGEITLKDPEGKIAWKIPVEEDQPKKIGGARER